MSDVILRTNHLTKKFGDQTVLKDISMQIEAGDIYGFLGVNGAGKSTTMKIILGLIAQDAGSVTVFGQDAATKRKAILRDVGALIEEPSFYPNLTGKENLQLIQKLLGLPQENVTKVLKIVNLQAAADKLVQNYSLGMKQRLAIAMALIKFPRFLILDEPTNGLDPKGMHEMRELIKSLPQKYGITVLISSHLLSEMAQMAKTVGIIKDGQLIYQGKMAQLVGSRKYFVKTNNPAIAKQVVASLGASDVAHLDDDVVSFNLTEAAKTAAIIKQLVAQNVAVYSLYGKKKSLEDVFLDLTGGGNNEVH